MGKQSKPCVIWVMPPELPEPVLSCFFDSITNTSFSVFCQAPVENNQAGGQPSYLLELQASSSSSSSSSRPSEGNKSSEAMVGSKQERHEEDSRENSGDDIGRNASDDNEASDEPTNLDEQSTGARGPDKGQVASSSVRRVRSELPTFHLTDLSPATQYTATIYVQNAKGRSRPASYQVSTSAATDLSGSPSGRVQFINKRLSASPSSSSSSSADQTGSSLADRLISYLRVDDYLSRSVNNFYSNTSNGLAGADGGQQLLARPLLATVGVVLLSSCTIIVVAFLLTRLCHRAGRRQTGRRTSTNSIKTKRNKRGESRIWCSSNSLGTKLSTYDGLAKAEPQLERPVQLTPAHSSSCSSSGGQASRLKALASGGGGGSGSDTSRETNTDSTLICSSAKSSHNNNNNNRQMIESPAAAAATAIVSSVIGVGGGGAVEMAAPAVRSSRESLYGGGGGCGAKSPIMMMMRPSQSVVFASEQHLRKCAGGGGGLYSTINRQQQQQQHNCSPLLAANSETPQMSIQSGASDSGASQTTGTTTTPANPATNNLAELARLQVNHSDNHRELHIAAAAAAAMSERCGSDSQACVGGPGSISEQQQQPLYVIRATTPSSASCSNFVVPPSCNRMVANQNCLNSSLQPAARQQQSIRLVGHKGDAAVATTMVPSEVVAPQHQLQNALGFTGWAYLSDSAAPATSSPDNRSGNGASLDRQAETQVDLATANRFGYTNGNASACNHHSLADASVSSAMLSMEPPIPSGFLPPSGSVPVSLSECQHLHLSADETRQYRRQRQRRFSQEFPSSDIAFNLAIPGQYNSSSHAGGGGGSGSYLTLAPTMLSSGAQNNYRQQQHYQEGEHDHQFGVYADQQQPHFVEDLSQSFVTYVAADADNILPCGGSTLSDRPESDYRHNHQCSASQTLDNSFRQPWRAEAASIVRRSSLERTAAGPQQARHHSRQGQRVKFDDHRTCNLDLEDDDGGDPENS